MQNTEEYKSRIMKKYLFLFEEEMFPLNDHGNFIIKNTIEKIIDDFLIKIIIDLTFTENQN